MSLYIPTIPRSSPSSSPFSLGKSFGAFPAELQDQIVDHLHDSPNDLHALSLVSRALRPAAQYHLFSTVKLGTGREFTAFVAALANNPLLLPLVRSLAIHEGRVDRDANWDWIDEHLSALPKLPNLNALSLHLFVWDFMSPDTLHTLVTAFPTVRALELVDCVFGCVHCPRVSCYAPELTSITSPSDFSNLRSLIGAFPDLDSFDASFCHWREHPVPADAEPDLLDATAPRLHTLRLSGCPQGPVARWLLRGAQPGALTKITSRDTTEDALRGVGALCAATGPALEHLHLSTWYHWGHNRQKPGACLFFTCPLC
jgi:hypothetical protein